MPLYSWPLKGALIIDNEKAAHSPAGDCVEMRGSGHRHDLRDDRSRDRARVEHRVRSIRRSFVRILIIGMGNVGVMHGWALNGAGVDVTHVVRKGSLAKYAQDIRMDVLDMRSGEQKHYLTVYRPRFVDEISPNDGYDLVMVATNHLQATGAVKDYKDMVPEADFLMFCANWEGPRVIDELIPRSRYLWGYSVFSGAKGDDGVLYANIQKTYRIGELQGSPAGMLDSITETFAKAGISPDKKENIIAWLWTHHAINAGLQGTVLVQGGLPSADTPLDVWVLIVRAVKDALRVVESRGVEFRNDPDTKLFQIENDEEAAKLMRQGISKMPHYERTRAHSHVAANPGEMKRYYLDVLETGEKLGVNMPYLGSIKNRILSLS
jgi:2-dehydropantoate 2-reductase